jgi:hypothetical protein
MASIRDAHDASGEAAALGRPKNDAITQNTGRPRGTPEGRPTRIEPDDDAATKRSIDRENAAALTLAQTGFRVKQNPSKQEVAEARRLTGDVGDPDKKPDYLVEGRVFDCYAPTAAKPVRGIWTEVRGKIDKGQTQRMVVDLTEWRGDMAVLRKQFADWPIEGFKEVKTLMPDGTIVQIALP